MSLIDQILMLINFFGGLAIFIYGIHIMADALQKTAGPRVKGLLKMLTNNKYIAVLIGTIVTMIIQSSSATTVMVVGFVNAGILELTQAIGVVMGANIGTTITGWIASASEWAKFLKPTTIAPLMVAIGVLMQFTSKTDKKKYLATFFIGFGLLFIGMDWMKDSVSPLADSEVFYNAFATLGHSPLLGILVGMTTTALVQSSSASMGILIALASTGAIPISAATYIIMGENIGTTVTAYLSSIGATKNARAASYMHIAFNVIGSLWFSIVAVSFFTFVAPELGSQPATATQIAAIHTGFNVTNVIVLLPFTKYIVMLGERLAGITEEDKAEAKKMAERRQLNLDERTFATPAVAVSLAKENVEKLYETTLESLDAAESFLNGEKKEHSLIKDNESYINSSTRELTEFHSNLFRLELSSELVSKVLVGYNVLTDIERIGDHIENLADIVEELQSNEKKFSADAQVELKEAITLTRNSYTHAVSALREGNIDKAVKAIKYEEEMDILEEKLRDTHLERLKSETCNAYSGTLYLDFLSNLERITDHANNIANYAIKYQAKDDESVSNHNYY